VDANADENNLGSDDAEGDDAGLSRALLGVIVIPRMGVFGGIITPAWSRALK
jgi:hypothetical protein